MSDFASAAALQPLATASGIVTASVDDAGFNLLDVGDGASTRVFTKDVVFAAPFASTPVVHITLAGIDVSEWDCSRIRLRPINITATGFTVEFSTWLGTRIWLVDASWLAIGH